MGVLMVLPMGCSSQGDERAAATPTAATAVAAVTLDDHAWKHRVLLAFAPDDNDALEAHRAQWHDVAGIEERDMVLFEIVGDAVWADGERRGHARALRERFGPDEGALTVVLIGKDGGEKMRGPGLAPQDVFATIDAMPMRQREMRERQGKSGSTR